MSLLIVPDAMKARLAAAEQPIELCAADGQVLGYFTPAKAKRYSNLTPPPLPPGEIERRLAEGGGRPLADILRDLATENS